MAVENLVTLSLDGSINDPVQKADRLLSYFFVNDEHQSNNQLGSIASLPGIIKHCANKPDLVANEIQSVLQQYYSQYFDNVNCVVETAPNAISNRAGNDLTVNLNVNLTFKQGGQNYNLNRIASIVNSKLTGIAEVNSASY